MVTSDGFFILEQSAFLWYLLPVFETHTISGGGSVSPDCDSVSSVGRGCGAVVGEGSVFAMVVSVESEGHTADTVAETAGSAAVSSVSVSVAGFIVGVAV